MILWDFLCSLSSVSFLYFGLNTLGVWEKGLLLVGVWEMGGPGIARWLFVFVSYGCHV